MSPGTIKAEPQELRTLATELRSTGDALRGLGGRAAAAVAIPPGPGSAEASAAAARFGVATLVRGAALDGLARRADITARLFELFDRDERPHEPGGWRTMPSFPLPSLPWFLRPRPQRPSTGTTKPGAAPRPTPAPAPTPPPAVPAVDGNRIVAVATAEIGRGEDGVDDHGADVAKYHAATGVGGAWCASFVAWTLRTAGVEIPPGGWAAVSAYVTDANSPGGRFQVIPADQARPGDLVVSDWGGAYGDRAGWDHIGIVTSAVVNGKFNGIDGNWGLTAGRAAVTATTNNSTTQFSRMFIRVLP